MSSNDQFPPPPGPGSGTPPQPGWEQPQYGQPIPESELGQSQSQMPYGQPQPEGMASYAAAPPPPAGQAYVQPDGIPGFAPAPWWKRLVARLIDTVISTAILVALGTALGDTWATTDAQAGGGNASFTYNLEPVGMAGSLLLTLLFEVILVVLLGGQIGKLVMGIRLRRESDPAQNLSWGQAIGRWLLIQVAFMACLLPGLVLFFSPLWGGPKVQGLHDKWLNTVVVEK